MKNFGYLSLSIVLIIHFASCNREGCTDPVATNYDPAAKVDDNSCTYPHEPVSIYKLYFNPVVNGNTITYDSMGYENEAGNKYSISNLKFYTSNYVLHEKGGDSVLFPLVNLSSSISLSHVPAGEYNKISFTLGLSPELNKNGMLANHPDNNNMLWPDELGGGYHYLKVNGSFMNTNQNPEDYSISMGYLKNGNDDFNATVRIELLLNEIKYVENMDGGYFHYINFDLNSLLKHPFVYDFNEHPNSLNVPALNKLSKNGRTAFSISGFGFIL